MYVYPPPVKLGRKPDRKGGRRQNEKGGAMKDSGGDLKKLLARLAEYDEAAAAQGVHEHTRIPHAAQHVWRVAPEPTTGGDGFDDGGVVLEW